MPQGPTALSGAVSSALFHPGPLPSGRLSAIQTSDRGVLAGLAMVMQCVFRLLGLTARLLWWLVGAPSLLTMISLNALYGGGCFGIYSWLASLLTLFLGSVGFHTQDIACHWVFENFPRVSGDRVGALPVFQVLSPGRGLSALLMALQLPTWGCSACSLVRANSWRARLPQELDS